MNRKVKILAVVLSLLAGPASAAESAVAVMYHRFGENQYPSTNIRLKQFEAHMEELKTGGYTVWPLPRIIEALQKGEALPDKTVAITIDDAFLSVYTEAFPRLKAAGFPFTLFLNPDSIGQQQDGFMTWDQVREVRDGGATIGNHTQSHLHMADADAATNRAEIANAAAKLAAELGEAPTLFAYPYGETSSETMKLVAEAGFKAAFGQHSGALGSGADPFYMPRFALNEHFGEIERFKTAVRSLALPVSDVTPTDVKLTRNPPAYGFTVGAEAGDLKDMTCYASHLGKVAPMFMGRRVEVRFDKPFPEGRGRINCTLQHRSGRWYWWGTQFVVRH